jgi:hypothetical protein
MTCKLILLSFSVISRISHHNIRKGEKPQDASHNSSVQSNSNTYTPMILPFIKSKGCSRLKKTQDTNAGILRSSISPRTNNVAASPMKGVLVLFVSDGMLVGDGLYM